MVLKNLSIRGGRLFFFLFYHNQLYPTRIISHLPPLLVIILLHPPEILELPPLEYPDRHFCELRSTLMRGHASSLFARANSCWSVPFNSYFHKVMCPLFFYIDNLLRRLNLSECSKGGNQLKYSKKLSTWDRHKRLLECFIRSKNHRHIPGGRAREVSGPVCWFPAFAGMTGGYAS